MLGQLAEPERFGAPYGLSYLPREHSSYQPAEYWRGPAWPQLNYLMARAAQRWGDEAAYWNPEDGTGLGAVPQGWAAVAAAL